MFKSHNLLNLLVLPIVIVIGSERGEQVEHGFIEHVKGLFGLVAQGRRFAYRSNRQHDLKITRGLGTRTWME